MVRKINLIEEVAGFLCVSSDEVKDIVKKFSRRYVKYKIPKKSGGTRVILHPCKEIKALQHAVNMVLLKNIPVHKIAYAYVPGMTSPLKKSAEEHVGYRYTLRIDFENFFPSIRPADLFRIICRHYEIDNDDCVIIYDALFYYVRAYPLYILPVGAPTSPTVSNIVMADLDEKFLQSSSVIDPLSSVTRYADDLYFSSNIKGACAEYYSAVDCMLRATARPSLKINRKKTLFLSKGTKRVVNGLVVTPGGKISVGRSRKELVKSMIYKHSKGQLSHDEVLSAQGMLAFIQDCEPEYYDKLALKYGKAFFAVKEYGYSV